MPAELLVAPAVEPLTLGEAKLFLRLDGSDEDDLVTAFILAARLAVEQLSRRLLIDQTWRVTFDRVPKSRLLKLPLMPVRSVVSLSVVDADGASTTVDPSAYETDFTGGEARIAVTDPTLPGVRLAGIEVRVQAGYGTAAEDVPEPLRQAMRLLVAHWYEHRGDVAANGIPDAVVSLLQPFRRLGLGA
ncbi:Phage gp6-like head-tail connector protein [Hartmannibacter diazotrophicus]|uniref:Phage gp6-like head-tail connector protein n=1 Tax=Hartmannibacter diazotrophicus TaxID=1482074 RepID=A0A2C9D3K5_9HYPH|nr:head-tail connector protein [Hartmannibacter diazotrophicus]SON54882.1 Phage gp6-like head-tail connector protein [Hartmannibacter diazotrophicus]